MGTYNYHFTNEEDAQNWSEQVGGTVYDNTHSPGKDWQYNSCNHSYTVHTDDGDDD